MKRPRPAIAWAVAVGYTVLAVLALLASGVDYDEAAASVGNLVRSTLVPTGILAVVLAALTSYLGWWRPVLRDDRPLPRWLLAVPILFVLTLAVGLLNADWASRSGLFVVVALLATLFVGFNEEIVFRGIGVVGLRAGHAEWRVWLYTTLLFALAHGTNFFAGQGVGPTVVQIVFAFALGTVLYVVRRVSGTLVVCIALHALWDFSSYLQG